MTVWILKSKQEECLRENAFFFLIDSDLLVSNCNVCLDAASSVSFYPGANV